VLRDTVTGGQPTMWQFWTLSEKIGTPEEVRDLETFLSDKPEGQVTPPRPLPQTDRLTAVGQFGVDLEYFLAAPATSPRWTQRYVAPFVDYGETGEDRMDSLHLQLPGDGAYFVGLYPRLRGEAPPTFSTLGEGTVIKISADWGTDYAFLSDAETSAAAEPARFRGTAAAVQDRQSGRRLSLSAPGEVAYRNWGLQADGPASLQGTPQRITVAAPSGPAAAPGPHTVTLTLPGTWRLAAPAAETTLERTAEGRWRLTLPADLKEVELVGD
jgi:hypothetical protein